MAINLYPSQNKSGIYILSTFKTSSFIKNIFDNNIFNDTIAPNITNHFEVYFPDQKTTYPLQNLPMERAFKGDVTDDIDVIIWDPEKQEKKRVLLSGRLLIDQNDKVVAAVVTIKDISKYKQLEEELKEKQRLLADREKRVNELEEMMQRKDDAIKLLQKKVADALLSYKNRGLTVVNKNGKIIGQIKWSSRMMGYAFQPTNDCNDKIKEFIKDLMNTRRNK